MHQASSIWLGPYGTAPRNVTDKLRTLSRSLAKTGCWRLAGCGSIGLLSWTTSSKQTPTNGVEDNHRMSFTVFLGNLPAWVTADDIKGWLTAENLVADAIKVIRNPETQES